MDDDEIVTDDTTGVIDAGTYEAKIAELTSTIGERDASIADLNGQLAAAKAANYDLLIAAGSPAEPEPLEEETGADDDGTDVSIDDLFGKD